jgi:hypothetical protein
MRIIICAHSFHKRKRKMENACTCACLLLLLRDVVLAVDQILSRKIPVCHRKI